jgi:hypothetical protein
MARPLIRDSFVAELVSRAGSVDQLAFELAKKGVKFSATGLYKAKKNQQQKIRRDLLLAAVDLYFNGNWNEMGKFIAAEPSKKDS